MKEDVILEKLEVITERQSDIKAELKETQSEFREMRTEVVDLRNTVINHINNDIAADNKKSFSKAPNWMLILLVFFLGRVSIEAVDYYEKIHTQPIAQTVNKPDISKESINASSSTLVATKPRKSLNSRIDDRVINKLIGDE